MTDSHVRPIFAPIDAPTERPPRSACTPRCLDYGDLIWVGADNIDYYYLTRAGRRCVRKGLSWFYATDEEWNT